MNIKNTYRQQALARRRGLSTTQRQQASDKVMQKFLEYLAQKPNLQHMPKLVYRALDDEVSTTSLFESTGESTNAKIYAPVTHAAGHMTWHRISATTRWQRGAFGICEPAGGDLWMQDGAILLCPLVGFDRSGNRLGLGKGCFDRWLAEHKNHMLQIIGLAFACQECPPIPAEAHDCAMDVIITEKEVIACQSN